MIDTYAGDQYAANAKLQLGSLAAPPATPYGNPGHVSFQRSDGPAQVAISASLTPEAALKLDAFLRSLIAEDAPIMAAWREKLQEQALAQQRAAYEQAMAAQQANAANWSING